MQPYLEAILGFEAVEEKGILNSLKEAIYPKIFIVNFLNC